ncbi:hypothetical protein [Pseudomonas aeruginosa]|uniref:hypothetical protein n=1 Tax=Pseudomonas aeruginosa TaxID=287 RepID=UPI001F3527F5|nr:hypothetical protein [Pseudomonas aeruginosa]
MQTLGARFQMRRVSLEPGRQPEAGMGSQIVERARLGGLARWFVVGRGSKIQNVFVIVNTICILFSSGMKKPARGGLF